MGSLLEEATVASGVLNKELQCLKKQVCTSRPPLKAGNKIEEMQTTPRDQDAHPYEPCREEAGGEEETNRIHPGTRLFEVKSEVVESIRELEGAIYFYKTDFIAEARKSLRNVFQKMSKADAWSFECPTPYGRRVLDRGKELFFKGHASCSVKHGTLLIDSSNGGAQFYVGLLNVVGAFAVTVSEYKLGMETFSKLISYHRKRNVTSQLLDLGAVYNNVGCISLINGDFNQAENYFKTSLKNFKSEKFQRPHNSSLDFMLIAVQSNISQHSQMTRNFGEAVEKQDHVVESCKAKKTNTLPHEVVFTVLNNQAMLHTTLTNFGKAEEALKWLISYCIEMNREDCDFLLNFVSLHLCEVLLLAGKSEHAEKAFSSEMLKRVRGTDLAHMFGGLHVNVRTEALEKVIDVLVRRGNVKLACILLEKSVNNLRKSFGPDHYNVASLLYKQGTILSLIGENSSSIEKFKCSIAILEEMFGVTHPLLLKCYMSLGDVALRLKREEDSYFYFQRAMENIEVLYQVSFVSQLSRKYVEITKNVKNTRERRVSVNRTESLVEGLVAEHGLAFAVLLSRLVVQHNSCPSERWNNKGKQPLITKSRSGQSSETMEIISLKCTRDFLQSGQMFVRQGMTKEAAAFFQQAGKYCTAYHMVQGPTNPCLARLYSVITNQRLAKQETLDNNRDLINCLEELSEVTTEVINDGRSKRASEDTAMMTSDCQLNLKLVLIFLILLSIELKMIDTTFAAYDLYFKLSQNDESLLLFFNGGVQVYASRSSITCNGKTAVQDVLVSSTIGINEDDTECPVPENQLFRSLACKKNVPTDSFLVTYNSSILLDIDDLQALERKISLSVQECFQLKCFETGIEGSATQILVDLTSKSSCDFYDSSSTGKRIELLSLCLSEEANAQVSHRGSVSVISTAMLQKISCLTFEDEHTSSFIFSKSALSLLQQNNSGKIFTLSVESQCLSMTVFHPVKARVTLWCMDKFIKQKVQFVQSARHGQTGWTVPQQKSCEELVGIRNVADKFSWPDLDQWAKAYHVKFLTDDVDSDEPLDVSNMHWGRHGIIFDGRQERCVQISSDETEENENLRICLNASVLEGLTFISDISSQLYGNGTQEHDDVTEVDPYSTETSSSPSSYQSPLQNEVTCSSFEATTMDPQAEMERFNSTLEAPDSTVVEEESWTREENSMAREEDDDELGRSLFEKDRKSRRSFMAELQESLKKKEIPSKSNFLKHEEETQKGSDGATDVKKAGTRHMAMSNKPDNSSTRIAVKLRSFEKPSFNAEAELQTRNVSASGLHDGRSREADDENALEGHLFEKEKYSRSSLIARFKDPPKEEMTQKSNSLGDENSPSCDRKSGKQDSVKDPCYHDTRKVESSLSLLPGVSGQRTQEDDGQSIIETSAENVLPKDEVEDATLLIPRQSEKPSSIHHQTQHQQESNLQEVHGPRTHIATQVKMDKRSSQVEEVKDHNMQERYGKEVRESKVQNKPLDNQVLNGNLTKPVTPRSSFEVEDDMVPDGPISGTPRKVQSNANESTSLTNTNGVDRSFERVGKNLQIQPGLLPENGTGMGTLGRSYVDNNFRKALQNGTQSTAKSQFNHKNAQGTTFRHPFRESLGGDVLVDGDCSNTTCEEDVVDGPVSTKFPKEDNVGIYRGEAFKKSLYNSKETNGNDNTSFPLDTARDVTDGPVYFTKTDANLNNMHLGFGGARPKQRSTNDIGKTSAITTKITEPIPPYQYDETEAFGIHPRCFARHTVTSNGAILEAPFHDGDDEPYFSAKAMTRGGSLQAPGKRFNPPGYALNGSGLGLDAEEAFAARPSTRGDVQSLSIHQKRLLYQKESWHFPPPVTDETPAMPNSCYIDQGYVERQHSTHCEGSIISKVKALFSSRESQRAYNEMDSMANEYHSSLVENRAVEPPTLSAGQRSETEDSTSSLLGSLQQIMAKTVKLIAVSDTVGKQPQQEPKEIEKVGIQEEARGSRDQEQAVTTVVEDSRNQEESSQENEQILDTERQSIPTQERQSIPVQESPRPVCSHYQRRCLVRFPCCGKFYPCHRCHNESEDCSDDQARAINATHIRCTICYHEQQIDDQSQTCGGCKSKMSEYFCPTCKHFTSVDKNPFHCDKCGICRIHRDRSFHCDVCNVCLDKRLQGKHKCRPDSGHDECCICLEDAFSGCQILPCSHKVHKDCAIAMIQNGVRTCPICRHPLFSQPQNTPQ